MVSVVVVCGVGVLGWVIPVAAQSDEAERVGHSTTVIEEIMAAPDGGVPGSVLEGAEAIAIFPSTIKAGFIFGGHRGRGNQPGTAR